MKENRLNEHLLQVQGLSVSSQQKEILSSISFEIKKGESVAIIGASGTGKTTLIRGISGLTENLHLEAKGKVYFEGRNFLAMTEKEKRSVLGRDATIIPQNCQDNFCPVVTIGRFMEDSWRAHGIALPKGKERFQSLLSQLGFQDPEEVWKAYPYQLSGGMCQRIAIAEALTPRPRLILADEPVSGLDGERTREAVSLFQRIKEEGCGFLIVTHQLRFAACIADRIIVINNGRMEEENETSEIFSHPQKTYTKELLTASFLGKEWNL